MVKLIVIAALAILITIGANGGLTEEDKWDMDVARTIDVYFIKMRVKESEKSRRAYRPHRRARVLLDKLEVILRR